MVRGHWRGLLREFSGVGHQGWGTPIGGAGGVHQRALWRRGQQLAGSRKKIKKRSACFVSHVLGKLSPQLLQTDMRQEAGSLEDVLSFNAKMDLAIF